MLELQLFGTPNAMLNGRTLQGFVTRKAEALLIYLAVNDQVHQREMIATNFWPVVAEVHAKNNLRRTLPNLRQLVGDYLTIDRYTITFNRQLPYRLDVEVFRTALTQLLSEPTLTTLSAQRLKEALACYRGGFLEGVVLHDVPFFATWVQQQREGYQRLAVEGLILLADYHLRNADAAAGLEVTQQLLGLEPWHEPAHRLQMRLLAGNGQYAEALAQYERCCSILAEKFGVAPSAETVACFEAVKQQRYEQTVQRSPQTTAQPTNSLSCQVEWGEIPRYSTFYGRQPEVQQLAQWLGHAGCALVAIVGIGGTGKTALAAQIVRSAVSMSLDNGHAQPFAYVMWRSLLNAPPLATLLAQWLLFLSGYQLTTPPATLDEQLALLFRYLQQQRCLLVLDNLESILSAQEAGHFAPGYEEYGLLLQRMGETHHRSCLLFTSREQPLPLPRLESSYPQVRTLWLQGLEAASGIQILQESQVYGSAEQMRLLVARYSGNPLALKVAAQLVGDFYSGNLPAFLESEELVWEDIRRVLDQQWQRLSLREQDLLYWLAIERVPISIDQLAADFVPRLAPHHLLETLRTLQRRGLVEAVTINRVDEAQGTMQFTLQNVVMEFTTNHLINAISMELIDETLDLVLRFALLKTQAIEHVQQTQRRLLLDPTAQRLVASFGKNGVRRKLQQLLAHLHTITAKPLGYAAANLLHLALVLRVDMTAWDFSALPIWQADLRQRNLPALNFAQADFVNTLFLEKFQAILTLAISPDGRWLAAGGASSDVQLWHLHTGQLLQRFAGEGRWVWAVAFSPDNRWLASAGADCTVYLRTMLPAGADKTVQVSEHYPLSGHRDTIFALAFSPDAGWLASAGADQTIRLWDLAQRQCSRLLPGHAATIYALAFHPNGQWLASADHAGTIYLWHLHSGESLRLADAAEESIYSLTFSQDGTMLIASSVDRHLRIWQIQPQPEQAENTFALPSLHLQPAIQDDAELIALALSPNGKIIATNGPDFAVRLWRQADGTLLQSWAGHSDTVQSLVFSPDGRFLVSGSWDQSIRIWDVIQRTLVRTCQGYSNGVAALVITPDGEELISGNANGALYLWEQGSGKLQQVQEGHSEGILTLALDPTGMLLASGGIDRSIQLWTLRTKRLLPLQRLVGHRATVTQIAFSPAGHLLASGSSDQTIRLWETATGRALSVLTGHSRVIQALRFHPDGSYLFSGDEDGKILRWRYPSPVMGEDRLVVNDHSPHLLAQVAGMIQCLAISPDGRLLAAAGSEHTIYLWELTTARIVARLETPVKSTIYALAFQPAATTSPLRLVNGSGNGTICCWEIDWPERDQPLTATLLYTIRGHSSSVKALLFTADGQILISGGDDEAIYYWDALSGRQLALLHFDPPYHNLKITGATGLTPAQRMALQALGARDTAPSQLCSG